MKKNRKQNTESTRQGRHGKLMSLFTVFLSVVWFVGLECAYRSGHGTKVMRNILTELNYYYDVSAAPLGNDK